MSFLVRHLLPGEILPPDLATGFEPIGMDPEWVWVATYDEYPVAVLVAAPCHGAVQLLRVKARKDAPRCAVLSVLRGMRDECRGRGIKAYLAMLGERDSELALAGWAVRRGDHVADPGVYVVAAGRL